MQEKRYGTLKGLTVPVLIYSTIDEADKAAGKDGTMLASANDNLHYRGGPAADTRAWLCEFLEKETGIQRKSKPAKDSKGNIRKDEAGNVIEEWDESEGEYASRVCAEKGWNDLKQFQSQVDAWAATADEGKPLAVDAKTPERKARAPKVLAAKYKEAAAVSISLGTVEKVNAAFAGTIKKTFTATGDSSKMFTKTIQMGGKELSVNVSDKDAETLGWLIKEHREFLADNEVNALVNG